MNTQGYLDYASATPIDPRVAEAMEAHQATTFANPSSMHTPGRQARKALESARSEIAQILGAKPAEIIFTSGSTDAIQIAIGGVMGNFPEADVAVAEIEHKAVLVTAAAASKETRLIPCTPSGITELRAVQKAITDTTVLVCVQYANNEIGTLQPVMKIAAEVKRVRGLRQKRGIDLPLYFYCDAAQAGLLNLRVSRLGIDLLSMGGSKLYGPPGSGFLYIRSGTQLKVLFAGGGQESGLRGGTENVVAAVGLSRALALMHSTHLEESQRLKKLRQSLLEAITSGIEGVELIGAVDHRLPHIVLLAFKDCDGETLAAHLDAAGFAVATGSACTVGDDAPSHVLMAIGCSEKTAESSIRISLGRFTSEDELRGFAAALIKSVAAIRRFAK